MIKFEFFTPDYDALGNALPGPKLSSDIKGLDFGKIQTAGRSGNSELLNIIRIRFTPSANPQYLRLALSGARGVDTTRAIPVAGIIPLSLSTSTPGRYTGSYSGNWSSNSFWVPLIPDESFTPSGLSLSALTSNPAFLPELTSGTSSSSIPGSLWFVQNSSVLPFSKNVGRIYSDGSDYITDYIVLDIRNNDHLAGITNGFSFGVQYHEI